MHGVLGGKDQRALLARGHGGCPCRPWAGPETLPARVGALCTAQPQLHFRTRQPSACTRAAGFRVLAHSAGQAGGPRGWPSLVSTRSPGTPHTRCSGLVLAGEHELLSPPAHAARLAAPVACPGSSRRRQRHTAVGLHAGATCSVVPRTPVHGYDGSVALTTSEKVTPEDRGVRMGVGEPHPNLAAVRVLGTWDAEALPAPSPELLAHLAPLH